MLADVVVWSDSKQLTEGVRPKVAVTQHGAVVVVYSKGKNDLYYVVGQLDAKGEIAWGAPTRYANGTRPGVALTNDARVIEVHQDNADKPSIYWMMGGINGTTITFANTGQLLYPEGSQGRSATVAFNASTSQAICIHEREAPDQPKLISNIGIVEKDKMNIQWIQGEIHSFDTGRNPSVATYDEFAVQTHAGGDQKEIWCSVSMVLDRNTWMERMAGRLDLKPLWKLTLPASHDSGMYALEDKRVREECRDLKIDVPVSEIKKYAKTQSRTIGEQLAAGIRYFDLRPVHDGGNFRVYHDLEGPNFLGENGILQQIATFFKGVQKELVIIKLKKFCNFDSNAHRLFIGEIQARLTNYLWDPGTTVTGEQLLHTTFGTFINSGPRLLIIYHDDDRVRFRDGPDVVEDHVARLRLVYFDDPGSTRHMSDRRKDAFVVFLTRLPSHYAEIDTADPVPQLIVILALVDFDGAVAAEGDAAIAAAVVLLSESETYGLHDIPPFDRLGMRAGVLERPPSLNLDSAYYCREARKPRTASARRSRERARERRRSKARAVRPRSPRMRSRS